MTAIGAFLIRQAGWAAARRFEAATNDPVSFQHRKLMEIVQCNRDTEYGRECGFDSIRSLSDYRRRVPVVSYDDIQPWVARIERGERNVLTNEHPVMLAQTSGTTAAPKYIPVTPTCLGRTHSDQMRTWIYHAATRHPGMFKGKVVSLISPAVEGHTESGLPYGSTTGHIYQSMPRLVRRTYGIPYEVFLIDDYDSRYYALMRTALAQDVTFVGTANPSSILKLVEYADRHADRLIRDLFDGTLRKDLSIDPAIRQVLENVLRPHPDKAHRLEKARAHRDGRLLPADYWPGLVLIGCWKGGTVGHHVQRFSQWFDPEGRRKVPVRDWGYLSSEARGSIPLFDEGSAGVLTVSANVMEFVEVDDLENAGHRPDQWSFLGPEELVKGQEYYVFFTTTGGLYRYDINDVVQVAGYYNLTPTIVFKRKGRGMANIAGEKLSVSQIIAAFDHLSRHFGITIDHFKAEPDPDNARYVFKIEASNLPASQRRPLLAELDRHLCQLNIEYRSKRKSFRLNHPLLQVMKAGWYERHRKALVARGKRLFQAKTIVLDGREKFQEDPENVQAVVDLQSG